MSDLIRELASEARRLANEAERLSANSKKNLVSFEAVELLTNIRQRLNVLQYMSDGVRENMKIAAADGASDSQAEYTALERLPHQEEKSVQRSRARCSSAGERAKRQAVRRGATLHRGAF